MDTKQPRIFIVDCDNQRRPLLEQLVRSRANDVYVATAEAYRRLSADDVPYLVFWHLGERQNEREDYALGEQVGEVVARARSWVAGFSGAPIAPALLKELPPEGDYLGVIIKAEKERLTAALAEAVERTVDRWVAAGGSFDPGGLSSAWAGIESVLEAKLDVLAARLEGRVPSSKSLQTLKARYPAIAVDGQSAAVADSDELRLLRDVLFER